MDGHKGHAKDIKIQPTNLGEPCKTIVNMMGEVRKWPYNNNTLFRFLKRTIFQTLTNHS